MTNVAEMHPDWGMMQSFFSARAKLAESAGPFVGKATFAAPAMDAEEAAMAATQGPKTAHRWSPYSFEGGTIAAISGEDWAVLASDTRMSLNDSAILNRKTKKLFEVAPGVVLGGCMFYGDLVQLKRVLEAEAMQYRFDFQEELDASSGGELLARLLYGRRFFPYYAWTMVGGLDHQGKGAVYSYDPVGCIERVPYVVAGNGRNLVEPIIAQRITGAGEVHLAKGRPEKPPLGLEEAEALLKDALIAAAERETGTGDSVHLVTVKAGQPLKHTHVPLRSD